MPTAPAEDQNHRQREQRDVHRLGLPSATATKSKVCGEEENQDADQEAEVAKACRDERLERGRRRIGRGVGVAGVGGRCGVKPEADQQVGREAHQLPADEEHQEVGAEHQNQHRDGEERELMKKREKPGSPAM